MNFKWESAAKILGGSLIVLFGGLAVVTFLSMMLFGSVHSVVGDIWQTVFLLFNNYAIWVIMIVVVGILIVAAVQNWIIEGVRELRSTRREEDV